MEETFRLDLNQSWEAIDIKTGHAVLIPKGSHQAIRMLLKSPPDQTEENYFVVAIQDEGGQVLAGLREAYWRLRWTLKRYVRYYLDSRSHLSLEKDSPNSRLIQFIGPIVAIPQVGGLHHRYERRAA